MFTTRSRKLAVTVAAVAIGILAHSAMAEAGTYKVCADAEVGSVCLNAGKFNLKRLKKGQNLLHQAQYATPLRDGAYFGTWKDGTNMVERINVKKGKLTMQRIAGGHGNGKAGPVVVFFRTGTHEYTNRNGSTIYVASPTTFTWRNNNNANHVFYQKID